jgi:hypothetical protein
VTFSAPEHVLIQAALVGMNVALLAILLQSLFKWGWVAVLGALILLGLIVVFVPQLIQLRRIAGVTVGSFLLIALIPALRNIEILSVPLDLTLLVLIVILGGILLVFITSFALLIYQYVVDYLFPHS